jgi:hypothetical protein
MHHVVNTRRNQVMPSPSPSFGLLEWVIELIRLWVTGRRCMENLYRLKNIKMKELKDSNDRKRTGVPRGDPKWGSGGGGGETAASELLVVVPFVIHVAIQWISFESIAKWSIANEIVKSTNLKDRLLLSEGLSIEVIPLPHCFVSPPHFFISLP